MHRSLTSNQVESIKAQIAASVEEMLTHLVARVEEAEPTLEGLERAVLDELHRVGNVTLNSIYVEGSSFS